MPSLLDWIGTHRAAALREYRARRVPWTPPSTVTLVALAPNHELLGGLYRSDHLQIVRGVEPEHLQPILDAGGVVMPPRAIVLHTFPQGTCSVHCFGCGAYIERSPEHWCNGMWLEGGHVSAFVHQHRDHVDWVFNRNQPTREPIEDEPPVVMELPIERELPEKPALAQGYAFLHSGS